MNLKIKKISNEEVIVFLNTRDLELFDLSPDSFEPRSAELHRFLFMLMETVREETGFDPYDGQVVVEAATSKNGVHLSISRIKRTNRKISKENFNRAAGVRIKSSNTGNSRGMDPAGGRQYRSLLDEKPHGKMARRSRDKRRDSCFIFIFSAYSDMESALCTLENTYIEKGELYRSGKRYAMLLPISSLDGCYHLLEFSESCSRNSIAADGIREGWKKVTEGGGLVELANAVRDMN